MKIETIALIESRKVLANTVRVAKKQGKAVLLIDANTASRVDVAVRVSKALTGDAHDVILIDVTKLADCSKLARGIKFMADHFKIYLDLPATAAV